MASVRIRGVSAKVDDSKIFEKAKKIRAVLGSDYRIIIEKGRIIIEGNIQDANIRRKIKQILAS